MEKSHHCITTASDILQIASPLFETTKFNFFSFFREYHDGSRIVLSTNPEWTYYLYNQEYVSVTEFESKPGKSDKSGCFIWEWLPNLLPHKALQNQFYEKMKDSVEFNITNGVTIIKNLGDSYEYFNFGTSEDKSYVYKFYFTRIDILERFIVFFKIKAEKLIQEGSKQKIILPTKKIFNNDESELIEKNSFTDFIAATEVKKFPFTFNKQRVFLTVRQLECLYWISNGLSAKKIAESLSVSHRTVEKHIQALKEMLHLHAKSDLIKLCENPLIKEYFCIIKTNYLKASHLLN